MVISEPERKMEGRIAVVAITCWCMSKLVRNYTKNKILVECMYIHLLFLSVV